MRCSPASIQLLAAAPLPTTSSFPIIKRVVLVIMFLSSLSEVASHSLCINHLRRNLSISIADFDTKREYITVAHINTIGGQGG